MNPRSLLWSLLLLAIFLAVLPSVHSAFATSTKVQDCHNAGSGATLTCALASAVTNGDLLVCGPGAEYSSAPTFSVTDSIGTTWVTQSSSSQSSASGSNTGYIYESTTITTGGASDTITIHFTASVHSSEVNCAEFTGVSSATAAGSATPGGATTGIGSTYTVPVTSYTPVTGDLVIAIAFTPSCVNVGTFAAPSGWTGYLTLSAGATGSNTNCDNPGDDPDVTNVAFAYFLSYSSGSTTCAGTVTPQTKFVTSHTDKYVSVCSYYTAVVSVTYHLKLHVMENGATISTAFVFSGSCNVNDSTISGNNVIHGITAVASCTPTITVQADGTYTRYRFNSSSASATTATFTTCPSGTCTVILVLDYYFETAHVIDASVANGYNFATSITGLTLTTTLAGTAGAALCSLSFTVAATDYCGSSSTYYFTDYAATISGYTNPLTWTGHTTDAYQFNTCSPVTTGSHDTIGCPYYYVLYNTPSAAVSQGGSYRFATQLTAVTVTVTLYGSTGQTGCTITFTVAVSDSCVSPIWADANTVLGGFPSTLSNPPSGYAYSKGTCDTAETTGGNTQICYYIEQYAFTAEITYNPSGNFPSGLSVIPTGQLGGSSGQNLCTVTTSDSHTAIHSCTIDAGSVATFAATLTGSATNVKLCRASSCSSPTTVTPSAGGTSNVNYWPEMSQTFKAFTVNGVWNDLSFTVLGTVFGTPSTTVCTGFGWAGNVSTFCSGAADNGTTLYVVRDIIFGGLPPPHQKWVGCLSGTNCVVAVPITAGNVFNLYFYAEYSNTFTATPSANWDAGRNVSLSAMIHGQQVIPGGCSWIPSAGTSTALYCTVYTDVNYVVGCPDSNIVSGTVWSSGEWVSVKITTVDGSYGCTYTLLAATSTTTTSTSTVTSTTTTSTSLSFTTTTSTTQTQTQTETSHTTTTETSSTTTTTTKPTTTTESLTYTTTESTTLTQTQTQTLTQNFTSTFTTVQTTTENVTSSFTTTQNQTLTTTRTTTFPTTLTQTLTSTATYPTTITQTHTLTSMIATGTKTITKAKTTTEYTNSTSTGVLPPFDPQNNRYIPVGTVLYLWYGMNETSWKWTGGLGTSHWNDTNQGIVVDTPDIGYYASLDNNTLAWQLSNMKSAGISVIIASWWGMGNNTSGSNQRLDEGINNATLNLFRYVESTKNLWNFRIAVMVEPFNTTDLTAADYTNLYNYVQNTFYRPFNDIVFYKDGKPLLLSFNPNYLPSLPAASVFTYRSVGGVPNPVDWYFWEGGSYNDSSGGTAQIQNYEYAPGISGDGEVGALWRYDDYYLYAAGGRSGYMRFDVTGSQGMYNYEWNYIIAHRSDVKFVLLYGWNEYHERVALEPHDDLTVGGFSGVGNTGYYVDTLENTPDVVPGQPGTVNSFAYYMAGVVVVLAIVLAIFAYMRRFK